MACGCPRPAAHGGGGTVSAAGGNDEATFNTDLLELISGSTREAETFDELFIELNNIFYKTQFCLVRIILQYQYLMPDKISNNQSKIWQVLQLTAPAASTNE